MGGGILNASVLRAGVIGLGAMGRNHARVLSALDGVELIGVVEPAAKADSSYGVPVLERVEQLIELRPDYAVVACPTGLHLEVGRQLAEAGIHALIEKPLADTVLAARELADVFRRCGLVAGVGHIERYNPALQSLRTRLSNGELGDLYQVATRRQGPFPARIADVGVVKDLATHDIDLTAWIANGEYVSVAARTSRRSGRAHEDMVLVVAELDGGTIVHHNVNWLSPLKERSVVVTGERGCLVADTLSADLTFYANGAVETEWETIRNFRGVSEGDMTRYALAKREPLVVEHEHFRDAVRSGTIENGIVPLDRGLRTVEVSVAVLTSAETGQTVRVGGA